MAELNPREIIEIQDSQALNERTGAAMPNTVERTVLYADGRLETYHYDDRSPPPDDVPWGRKVGTTTIDRGQRQLWDDEVKAEKERNKPEVRPSSDIPTGFPRPGRLDTPAVLRAKRAEAIAAGFPMDLIDEAFPVDADGAPVRGGGSGGGGGGRGQNPATTANFNSQIMDRELSRPSEIALRESQIAENTAQIEDLKRKAIPQQTKLFQDAAETIADIHRQLTTPGSYLYGRYDQANAYYKAVDEYVQAGLKGSTPYEMYKEAEKQKQERAKMGVDLLNQRLQSGTQFASNLFSEYGRQITANGGILRNTHGGSGPIFEYAQDETDRLQGGSEVTGIAKALLAAVDPSQQQQGGVSPEVMAYLEQPQVTESVAAPTMLGPAPDEVSPEVQAYLDEEAA